MKPFFVYMLRCRDGSFYVGHTDDLEKRVAEHQHGAIPGHTSTRRPVELVWSSETDTRDRALETEMQIKRWSRAKKEALIRGDWVDLVRLSGPRTGPDRRRSIPPPEGVERPSTGSGRTEDSLVRPATGSGRTESCPAHPSTKPATSSSKGAERSEEATDA